ncbi:hypothetical protein EXIGLDRAFT_440054 [Exidia glandulosa HHB12029]|uniref:Uncharacterized protein n=1 Tax=Exidia glandulosa HHB12029 TaxID=1314781 RepID=A0A165Z731_EXIGL|nr:hypothetical protein EXIGLDRAFT_440054 [Exidia glandulosa HHB12029]
MIPWYLSAPSPYSLSPTRTSARVPQLNGSSHICNVERSLLVHGSAEALDSGEVKSTSVFESMATLSAAAGLRFVIVCPRDFAVTGISPSALRGGTCWSYARPVSLATPARTHEIVGPSDGARSRTVDDSRLVYSPLFPFRQDSVAGLSSV